SRSDPLIRPARAFGPDPFRRPGRTPQFAAARRSRTVRLADPIQDFAFYPVFRWLSFLIERFAEDRPGIGRCAPLFTSWVFLKVRSDLCEMHFAVACAILLKHWSFAGS